jgi:hypothetical protein
MQQGQERIFHTSSVGAAAAKARGAVARKAKAATSRRREMASMTCPFDGEKGNRPFTVDTVPE